MFRNPTCSSDRAPSVFVRELIYSLLASCKTLASLLGLPLEPSLLRRAHETSLLLLATSMLRTPQRARAQLPSCHHGETVLPSANMLQTYIRAASRRGAAARTATTVARPHSTTVAARTSIVHDALVLTPAQRRRHIFNEALAMTPEARAGLGPHVTFLRALARRLLDPAVMLPHGRVHTTLDAEPELTPADELELVGGVGRVGWEYR